MSCLLYATKNGTCEGALPSTSTVQTTFVTISQPGVFCFDYVVFKIFSGFVSKT